MSKKTLSSKKVIINEIKKRHLQDEAIDIEEFCQIVIVLLNDSYYGFYGADIKEIIDQKQINYVPGCPSYLLGVINVRGDIESVVSLHSFLELPKANSNKIETIVIAKKNGIESGFQVDSVIDVIDLPLSTFTPPPYKHEKGFVAAESFYKGECVTILDIGKIFKEIMGGG